MERIERVVVLGASNLVRGMSTVVATARAAWGTDVEIFAALGHGRSYGTTSRVLVRTLPGILESGLWRELMARPPRRTRGVVTDVGNDIMYGATADEILGWVEGALRRLTAVTSDLVMTDLPLTTITRLSRAKFLVLRSCFFPSCRIGFSELMTTGETVHRGIADLARAYGARLVSLEPSWYGFDPIHIRAARRPEAWRRILDVEAPACRRSRLEGLRLWLMRPERRWICGVEQLTPQTGRLLRAGGRVWLY